MVRRLARFNVMANVWPSGWNGSGKALLPVRYAPFSAGSQVISPKSPTNFRVTKNSEDTEVASVGFETVRISPKRNRPKNHHQFGTGSCSHNSQGKKSTDSYGRSMASLLGFLLKILSLYPYDPLEDVCKKSYDSIIITIIYTKSQNENLTTSWLGFHSKNTSQLKKNKSPTKKLSRPNFFTQNFASHESRFPVAKPCYYRRPLSQAAVLLDQECTPRMHLPPLKGCFLDLLPPPNSWQSDIN